MPQMACLCRVSQDPADGSEKVREALIAAPDAWRVHPSPRLGLQRHGQVVIVEYSAGLPRANMHMRRSC
jgi:hypothetical protein